MLTTCFLIIVHVLVAVLASGSSANTSLDTSDKYFPVGNTLAHARGEAASHHYDSPQVRPRVSACEHDNALKKLFNVSLEMKSEYLLAADILARAQSEMASHHFDSPQIRLRVNTDERETMLSKIIGTRITVQPLQETTTYQKHIRKVTILRAFTVNPPFEAVPYLDQHENTHHVLSAWPFFFSIAPLHYDTYGRSKISVGAVDLVKMSDISFGFKMSSDMLVAARNLREKALKARFFPPLHRPLSVPTGKTITYRLMLPLDNLFRPDTFSHPFIDLGDVLKIVGVYCARQKVDFHAFYPQIMPSAHIVPLYSDLVEETRFFARYYNDTSMRKEAISEYFMQVFAGPTFRLIKPGTPIYMQRTDALRSVAPWPSLVSIPMPMPHILISRQCELVTNLKEQSLIGHAVRFSLSCVENHKHKLAFAKSIELAKKVWLDIEIPTSTPEKLHMVAAIVELRRLSVHIDLEEISDGFGGQFLDYRRCIKHSKHLD